MKKIIVTGSSGFIGTRLLTYNKDKYLIKSVSLQKAKCEDIDFTDIEAIIHLAGIAHRMDQPEGQIYYDVNANLAEEFALKAKEANVKSFVYVSTVKVYGDQDDQNIIYDENSACTPNDDYGKSKLIGETKLIDLQSDNFHVAIVRPPLVYGPRVKGNMIKLLRLVDKGLPLPLKNIKNQRSSVFVDNLIELINTIIDKKAAGVYIAGDASPVSTSDLIAYMYKGLGKKPFWFSMPGVFLKALKVVKPAIVSRLFESYIIDNSSTNQRLGFTPPFTSEYGVKQMTDWYLNNNKHD